MAVPEIDTVVENFARLITTIQEVKPSVKFMAVVSVRAIDIIYQQLIEYCEK